MSRFTSLLMLDIWMENQMNVLWNLCSCSLALNPSIKHTMEITAVVPLHCGPHVRTFANLTLSAPWPAGRWRMLWYFSLHRIYQTGSSSGKQRLSLRAFKCAIEWASFSLSIMDQPPKSKQRKQRFNDNEIDVLVHEVTGNLNIRAYTRPEFHTETNWNYKFQ